MRANFVLLLSGAAILVAAGCQAPTQHTGKRPMAARRSPDTGRQLTVEERMEQREARLRETDRRARTLGEGEELIGVGSTHRFHFPDCEALRDVPNADRIFFVSRYDALDGGYDPCTLCRPQP